MGHFIVDVGDTEDQEYLKQNIDMLSGRIKTEASVVIEANSDVIKAILVNSPIHTDEEINKMWEAIKSVNPQRRTALIPDDSPLQRLHDDFSREQILIFDGIRYAAEMADIAYWRLFDLLQEILLLEESKRTNRKIAIAMLDAWSIVDSVHRLRDLLNSAPGVTQDNWWKLFMRRTEDIAELRNAIQHQIDKTRRQWLVTNKGQVWGYLSWAETRNGRYTGDWYMMSPGAVYQGDQWIYCGPALTSVPLPFGRLRLHAYGKEIYLGKAIKAVHDAVDELTEAMKNGVIRPVGSPAMSRRGSDIIYGGRIEALLTDGRKVVVLPDTGL